MVKQLDTDSVVAVAADVLAEALRYSGTDEPAARFLSSRTPSPRLFLCEASLCEAVRRVRAQGVHTLSTEQIRRRLEPILTQERLTLRDKAASLEALALFDTVPGLLLPQALLVVNARRINAPIASNSSAIASISHVATASAQEASVLYAPDAPPELVLAESIFVEAVAAMRRLEPALDDRLATVDRIQRTVNDPSVRPTDPELIDLAIKIMKAHPNVRPDNLLLLAHMRHEKIRVIVTNDQHVEDVKDISVFALK